MFEKLKNKFSKIIRRLSEKKIGEAELKNILDDFVISLIESDVSLDTATYISERIKSELLRVSVPRLGSNLKELVKSTIREVLLEILYLGNSTPLHEIIYSTDKRPYTIVFFGVNGVGKTTTIAKVAKYLLNNKFKVVLACSDTFRAAAIEQLKCHANKLGVKMISQQYGADPAAVAYDAVMHAISKKIDVVLIDTAGRQHSNINLMDELRKIVRVVEPDLKILVLDALTGNDAINQAVYFNNNVGVDTYIFTKVDADIKGGTIISVLHNVNKPILFLGTGQRYEDLVYYKADEIIKLIL